MRAPNKFFLSIFIFLILVSTLYVMKIEYTQGITPTWEYIAPEMSDFDLYGGLSQWSAYSPASLTLQNLEGSGINFSLDIHFGFNSSHIFIGILIPFQDVTVYGLEIIFITNDGIYDGIIVDSVLEESRDVTYVNNTHVVFDTDLDGTEDSIPTVISSLVEATACMIAENTEYTGVEGSDWNVNEGDSVAVVFQAWVNHEKNDASRPNFSTVMNSFNYLRLSIGYDSGVPLDLMNPINIGKKSEVDFTSRFNSELDILLDGKKDEDFWKLAPTYTVEIYSILQLAASSLIGEVDSRSCNISFANDEEDLFVFIENQKENAESNIDELLLILGQGDNCLYNLSSELLVCIITPYDGCSFLFTRTVDLMSNGIASENKTTGIICFDVPDWSDTSDHFDLYEGESSSIIDNGEKYSAEFIIPILKNEPTDYLGLFNFSNNGMSVLPSPNVITSVNEVFEAKVGISFEATLEADQIKIIMHKLIISVETEETTRTNYESVSSLLIFSSLISLEVILRRKREK